MNTAESEEIQRKLDDLDKRAAATDEKTKELTQEVERVKADVNSKKEHATLVQRLLARR